MATGVNVGLQEMDLRMICRFCLSPRGVMSHIFDPSRVKCLSLLASRIMDFTTVKVLEGDGLPTLICHRCLSNVELVYEFKALCEASDVLLRAHLNIKAQDLHVKQEALSEDSSDANENSRSDQPGNTTCDPFSFKSYGAKEEAVGGMESVVLVVDPSQSADEVWSGSDTERADRALVTNPLWADKSALATEVGELNCRWCNKLFPTKESLERHIQIHKQEPPFPCDYCAEWFVERAALKAHWRHHAPSSHLLCQTCGEAFPDRTAYRLHTATIHDTVKPFRCPTCGKAFAYRSDLRKHAVIHTGIRPYVCTVCRKTFTRSTNLNKHARTHSDRRPYPCTGCSKVFATRADMARHAVVHTGAKPYTCAVCSLAFNRKDKLTRHERLHNGTLRAHACAECPTSFHRREELTKHARFQHFKPDQDAVTSEMDESVTPPDRNDRISRGRDTVMTSPLRSVGTTTQEDAETEDVVISVDPYQMGGPPYSCPSPPPTAVDQPEPWAAPAVKPFACHLCSKTFCRKRELIRHDVVHTGYRPYKCEICDKAFARRDKLARHLRTHLAGKRLDCGNCPARFASRDQLIEHQRAVHDRRMYVCDECYKTFSTEAALVRHARGHKGVGEGPV